MRQTSRSDGLFLGCAVGLTLLAGLAVGVPVSLYGPLGALTDYLIELTVLSAVFGAYRLAERLQSYRAGKAALRRGLQESRLSGAAVARSITQRIIWSPATKYSSSVVSGAAIPFSVSPSLK